MGQHQRTYTDDFKAGAVDRLYEPGATQGSVAKELGITGTQLKSWRLLQTITRRRLAAITAVLGQLTTQIRILLRHASQRGDPA